MLKSNNFYGYKAIDIYKKCCEEYNFDTASAKRFTTRKRLYSGDATPEGYGVWFISNSNWTKTKGGMWKNTIAGSFNWIKETWDEDPDPKSGCFDFNRRVVFAKDPKHYDGYIFLGVYEPVCYDDATKTREFRRISDSYEAA